MSFTEGEEERPNIAKILLRPLVLPGAILLSSFGLGYFYMNTYVSYPILRRLIWTGWMWGVVTQLRNRIIVPFVLLPSLFLSRLREKELEKLRQDYLRHDPINIRRVKLRTEDGIALDGLEYVNNQTEPATQRWIIWFNPNGAAYEEEFPFLVKYANEVGASILAFNYRGVGLSLGSPKTSRDLVRDGEAAMAELLRRGVQAEHILLHGHSMGGAVATHVRSLFPKGPLINDRSFRSLGSVTESILENQPPLGVLVGAAVGAGGALWACLLGEVGWGSLALYPFLSSLTMAIVGKNVPIVVQKAARGMMSFWGWSFDVEGPWHQVKGPKAILFHELDGIIAHRSASLAVVMEEHERIIPLRFIHTEISRADQFYHCYSLDSIHSEWSAIITAAREMLHESKLS